jgi:hypothetical protein
MMVYELQLRSFFRDTMVTAAIHSITHMLQLRISWTKYGKFKQNLKKTAEKGDQTN